MAVDFLYTNIGRGHPYYLDGIIECMAPDKVGRVTDVFALTSGPARLSWTLARKSYRLVGRSRAYSRLYSRFRANNDFNRGGLAQSLMGRPLRRCFLRQPNPLVVAHPLLAAILKGKSALIYQHGEVGAPRESLVIGGHRVLVPLSATADVFLQAGLAANDVFVSGLCIEPALLAGAKRAFAARLDRLSYNDALCGAFFSSGAEPREHVQKLDVAAVSAARAGGRVLIFAQRSGPLAAQVRRGFAEANLEVETVSSPTALRDLATQRNLLVLWSECGQLDQFTAELFGAFDYFVAPAHERTHWAAGLGLPMFVLDPSIGSFSPLNRNFLLTSGVARALSDVDAAEGFGAHLRRLRESGEVRSMAEAGWGRFDTNGFANIAAMLSSL